MSRVEELRDAERLRRLELLDYIEALVYHARESAEHPTLRERVDAALRHDEEPPGGGDGTTELWLMSIGKKVAGRPPWPPPWQCRNARCWSNCRCVSGQCLRRSSRPFRQPRMPSNSPSGCAALSPPTTSMPSASPPRVDSCSGGLQRSPGSSSRQTPGSSGRRPRAGARHPRLGTRWGRRPARRAAGPRALVR